MSDLVLNVKQISNYPQKTNASGLENILLQAGLGAPYQSISAATLVATAINQGPAMGVGATPPANADGNQLFLGDLNFPPTAQILWDAYGVQGDGEVSWTGGQAASQGWSPNAGFNWATAPIAPGNLQWFNLMWLDPAGSLHLPLGTLSVARDPSAPFEVATANWVRNNTVQTFNNRTGPITLNSQDVYTALQLTSPIATQDYAYSLIQQSIQNLLLTCPLVNSFNGRSGQVYLNLSDITCVFFQSGQQPISPTPPLNSNDNSIATTQWVTDFINPPALPSPTPPLNPHNGQLWWDAIDGNLYVYYDDGTSAQWVSAMAGGASGALSTAGGTMLGPLYWTATGAVTSRAAQDRSAEQINVKDYGAKGDGATDDTAAVQAAFTAAAAGGEIYFPPGTYVLAGTITQSFTGSVTVRGSGPGVSLLSCASNGLAINLASNQNAIVRDLSIVTTAAGLANTGLSVTSPDQSAQVWLENLRVRGNTGGTTGWQTSINIVGCGVPRIRGITVLTVNGPGTGLSGATCIAIAGVSSAANSDNYQISDCQLQGGLYGLYIGNYVEGVLLTNVVILGNDYGVYASNNGNMLEVTNCHINPGVCGVYANAWGFISVVSTFFLRFATGTNWTAIDLEASGEAAISACNFFGNNTGTEIAILVNNGVNTPTAITGNTFVRLRTAAVRLTGTTAAALVTGNNAGSMQAGSVLVNDTTGNASNQVVANNFNGTWDIKSSNNNLIVAGNGVQYGGVGGTHVLGFTWGTVASGTISVFVDGSAQGNVVTDQYAFTRSNYANDAAAATGGVPVGGLYRNGSALMVRMA